MTLPLAIIAEDEPLLRAEIRHSLYELWPELNVCAEAEDGLQAMRIIREQQPDTKVLILSQHDSSFMLGAALKAGASGYVTKSQVSRSLLGAIDTLIEGKPFSWNSEEMSSSAGGSSENLPTA